MAWLADFVAAKGHRLYEQRHTVAEEALAEIAASRPPARDFVAALRRGPTPAIIAEVKFASPSKGVLRPARDVEVVAAGYAAAGARALSILTEPTHFAGDLAFLERASVASRLPILRKDFLLDPYEVTEARAHGADAVLLIARLLTRGSLAAMVERAEALGMAALVEIHGEDDLVLLEGLAAPVVGVNHRDLDTLAMDPSLSARLAGLLPEGAVWVAESGLETGADLRRMVALGYEAVLVGSAFMSRPDPGAALAALLEDARAESGPNGPADTRITAEGTGGLPQACSSSVWEAIRVPPSAMRRQPQGWGEVPSGSARGAGREWPLPVRAKICGLTREEDALLAWALGAAALGFVFHPLSPRCVTPARAAAIRRALPQEALCVGVFVDLCAEAVNDAAAEAGLGAVQLHGSEKPETVAAVELPVIKALRPKDLDDPGRIRAYRAALVLLDAYLPGQPGGTGLRADWTAAARLARAFSLVLAGGLGPENVLEALASVSPYALDVNSGVESAPGVKSPEKLRALFAALPLLGGRSCLLP